MASQGMLPCTQKQDERQVGSGNVEGRSVCVRAWVHACACVKLGKCS